MKDKNLLVAKLRWIFESQGFHDFYTGPMDSAITGEFERGTPKHQENEEKVLDYLSRMVDKLNE